METYTLESKNGKQRTEYPKYNDRQSFVVHVDWMTIETGGLNEYLPLCVCSKI